MCNTDEVVLFSNSWLKTVGVINYSKLVKCAEKQQCSSLEKRGKKSLNISIVKNRIICVDYTILVLSYGNPLKNQYVSEF